MSSYQFMDHAKWVEENNATAHAQAAKSRAKRRYPLPPTELTPFQAKVMDILGMVFGGIYNAPIAWEGVEWHHGGRGISVPVGGHGALATYDFSHLTLLVFLCHEARIRGQIEPNGPRGYRFAFWQRDAAGDIARRHPNLDEAVKAFRAWLPDTHRIIHRAEPVPAGPQEEAA